MRYALISDIHGNLEALNAVLAEIDKLHLDTILCLGDVVGYGPNPNECVQIVRTRAAVCLIGNHDEAALGRVDLEFFNYIAREAIEWTMKQLNRESIAYLTGLPYTHEFENNLIVHASPDEPRRWNYIISLEDAEQSFEAFAQQLCFIGHSHTPWVIDLPPQGRMQVRQDYPVAFREGHRYLINVGSVGQPRDRNPAAAFGVWDTVKHEYTLKRVPYEVAKTQKKIRAHGLPSFLADRLASGQ